MLKNYIDSILLKNKHTHTKAHICRPVAMQIIVFYVVNHKLLAGDHLIWGYKHSVLLCMIVVFSCIEVLVWL